MLSTDSISVVPFPNAHVLPVKVIPYLRVFVFVEGNVIPHDYDFVLFGDVPLGDFSVVQVDLTVHFEVLVCESNEVFVVLVTL